MAVKRTYSDGCAVAHSLDLIGERWALLVVRELVFGPKRFTDLRAGIPHGSASMLAQRLRELEDVGIVARRKLGPPSGTRVYELTAWGEELRPVLQALGRWGARSPFMQHDAEISADSLMLALETLFDPTAALGLDANLAVGIGDDGFRVRLVDQGIHVERGRPDRADATLDGDPAALSSVIWEGRRIDDAVRAGDLEVEGDLALVQRFVRLFPLPAPATQATDHPKQTMS